MCLLLVLRGRFASHPVLVAGNRDERTDRKASPPGLWVGQRQRMISPRDREKGGTWLCVGRNGMFAGLTNWSRTPPPPDAATRGELPHLAVDAGSVADAQRAVLEFTRSRALGGFQLVLADADRMVVIRHADGRLESVECEREFALLTNEHGPGELSLPGLDAALAPRATPQEQLEAMRPLLLLRGANGEHAVLKKGPGYGTVSSSLIAAHRDDPLQLVWRFASGPPDEAPYQNYGNLARRLVE